MYKFIAILLACFNILVVSADEEINFDKTKLTGDWEGNRTDLLKKYGVNFELNYTLDTLANASGGIKTGVQAMDEIDFYTHINGSKLWNIEGSKAKIYIYRNNFGHLNEKYVGSAQGIDSNESSHDLTHLDEAWLSQDFYGNKISILAGLYDFTYEYYQTSASGIFLHPTFNIGAELSNSGSNGPAEYSTSALSIRTKIIPSENSYIQFAVMDGIPAFPTKPSRATYHLYSRAGAVLIAEAGITPFTDSLFAIGSWRYTKKQPDLVTNGSKYSEGIYGMAQKQLYNNSGKVLTGFLRVGKTDANTERFTYAWSTGINYEGLFPSRSKGIVGLAFQQAVNSKKFRQDQFNESIDIPHSEYGVELLYQDHVAPGIMLQPDLQYILNPSSGASKISSHALVIGFRTELSF